MEGACRSRPPSVQKGSVVSAQSFGKRRSAMTLPLGKSFSGSTGRELAQPVHFCVPPVGSGFEKFLGRRPGLIEFR
jgi:hypothetical protein